MKNPQIYKAIRVIIEKSDLLDSAWKYHDLNDEKGSGQEASDLAKVIYNKLLFNLKEGK